MKQAGPNTTLSRPDVREYTDSRVYLQAIYDWRKQRSSSFSYTTWARELAIQSRSFLRLVITGKRTLTDRLIPVFVKSLELDGAQAEYFERLVRYTQSSSHQERASHWSALQRQSAKGVRRNPVFDHHQFLSSRLGPRLRILISYAELERTPTALARLLKTPVAEIKSSLKILERLGLARFDVGSQQWSADDEHFAIEDKAGSLALQTFHRQSIEEAGRAVDLPPSTRDYRSLLILLDPSELTRVRSEVDTFFASLLDKYGRAPTPGTRLYQINANAIPVSEPVFQPGKSRAAPMGASAADTRPSSEPPQEMNP